MLETWGFPDISIQVIFCVPIIEKFQYNQAAIGYLSIAVTE